MNSCKNQNHAEVERGKREALQVKVVKVEELTAKQRPRHVCHKELMRVMHSVQQETQLTNAA